MIDATVSISVIALHLSFIHKKALQYSSGSQDEIWAVRPLDIWTESFFNASLALFSTKCRTTLKSIPKTTIHVFFFKAN